jgi:hypothetical protein
MGLLVVITVYDMRHKIIPDQCSYLFAALTFLRLFISFDISGALTLTLPTLPVLIAGPALAFPFYIIWLVSNGRWMGLGDAKLSLGLGWFVAIYANAVSPLVSDLSVFLYAFWVGTAFFICVSIVSTILSFLSKIRVIRKIHALPSIHLRSEIPFAPFLIIGLLIVFLMRYNIASLIFNNYFL